MIRNLGMSILFWLSNDAPRTVNVLSPSAVYRPTAKSAWSPGFFFTVYFKSAPQDTHGVRAIIRPCATEPDPETDRTIEQESFS